MKRFSFLLLTIAFLISPSFAGDVNVVHTNVNIAATSTAASARSTRRILILQNMSDAAISCKAGGATAVAGEGWVMNPQLAAGSAGGAFFFDVEVPTGAINCIHGGSGNKVLIVSEG